MARVEMSEINLGKKTGVEQIGWKRGRNQEDGGSGEIIKQYVRMKDGRVVERTSESVKNKPIIVFDVRAAK